MRQFVLSINNKFDVIHFLYILMIVHQGSPNACPFSKQVSILFF